jgi:hypothetical protein
VDITGHSSSVTFPDLTHCDTAENDVNIAVYRLHREESQIQDEQSDDEDRRAISCPFKVTCLPHESFDGAWEALVHEDPVDERLLRCLTRATWKHKGSKNSLSRNAWYNTALLYGPPGSGK